MTPYALTLGVTRRRLSGKEPVCYDARIVNR